MRDDEILYHYTTIEGLNGIIRSRKVWASDSRYLNDKQELKGAIDLFLKKYDGVEQRVLSTAFHWHSFSRAHCVFSLSRSPRVLSQWRAYADDGRGAAIGFKRKFLAGHTKSTARYLVDCIYHNHDEFLEELKDSNAQAIDELVKMYGQEGAVNSFWDQIDKKPEPLERIFSELLRVKNAAFIEEQEVRLVVSAPANVVNTRASNGLIIPYIEHEFAEEGDANYLWYIVPEIWFGPKSDERNKHSIMIFQQLGWLLGNGIYTFDCGYI